MQWSSGGILAAFIWYRGRAAARVGGSSCMFAWRGTGDVSFCSVLGPTTYAYPLPSRFVLLLYCGMCVWRRVPPRAALRVSYRICCDHRAASEEHRHSCATFPSFTTIGEKRTHFLYDRTRKTSKRKIIKHNSRLPRVYPSFIPSLPPALRLATLGYLL